MFIKGVVPMIWEMNATLNIAWQTTINCDHEQNNEVKHLIRSKEKRQ
jgi:hypothetical protein